MSDNERQIRFPSIKCDKCGEEIPPGVFRTTDGFKNYHMECYLPGGESPKAEQPG